MEELIVQHDLMNFGNASVNTIRTHTVLDRNGKAHVIKAILRAGCGNTFVDNYAHGGVIYEVDVNEGIVCSKGKTHSAQTVYIHPQTQQVMLGYRIPHWKEVLHISKQAAEQLPQVGLIGWDVAIRTNSCELIEGNHNPDYELLEFLGSGGYYSIIENLI